MKQINSKDGRTYETELGNFPSVTSVMSLKDKSFILMQWSAKCVTNYLEEMVLAEEELVLNTKNYEDILLTAKTSHKRIQQEALDVGTQVHDLIEGHIKSRIAGEVPATPTLQKYDVQVQNSFKAFLEWESETDVEWIKSEAAVYSKHKFAGTLDAVAKIDGKLFLLDFKTSKAIYDDALMQLVAYKVAYEERTNEKIEGLGILRLDKVTAKPQWISTQKKWTESKCESAYKKFVCLLTLYWLEKEEKDNARKLAKTKKLEKNKKINEPKKVIYYVTYMWR